MSDSHNIPPADVSRPVTPDDLLDVLQGRGSDLQQVLVQRAFERADEELGRWLKEAADWARRPGRFGHRMVPPLNELITLVRDHRENGRLTEADIEELAQQSGLSPSELESRSEERSQEIAGRLWAVLTACHPAILPISGESKKRSR